MFVAGETMKTSSKVILTIGLLASISLFSLAEAAWAFPPSGKYFDVRDGLYYEYDAVAHTLTPATGAAVNPICDQSGSMSQCGECMYLPNAQSWQLNQPYTDTVACLNVADVAGQNALGQYRADVRVDARVIDSSVWSYQVELTSFVKYPATGAITHREDVPYTPVECTFQTIAPGTIVNFCGEGTVPYTHSRAMPFDTRTAAAWSVKWVTGARAGLEGHYAHAFNY